MAQSIIEQVNTQGFCCTSFSEPIPGLEMMRLPIYLDVESNSKMGSSGDGKSFFPLDGKYKAVRVGEINEHVNDWLKVLNFEYQITGKEKGELQWKEWMYVAWDLPLLNNIKFEISVYYRKRELPSVGNKFKLINQNGHVIKGYLYKDEDGDVDFGYSHHHSYISFSMEDAKNQDNLLMVPCH